VRNLSGEATEKVIIHGGQGQNPNPNPNPNPNWKVIIYGGQGQNQGQQVIHDDVFELVLKYEEGNSYMGEPLQEFQITAARIETASGIYPSAGHTACQASKWMLTFGGLSSQVCSGKLRALDLERGEWYDGGGGGGIQL